MLTTLMMCSLIFSTVASPITTEHDKEGPIVITTPVLIPISSTEHNVTTPIPILPSSTDRDEVETNVTTPIPIFPSEEWPSEAPVLTAPKPKTTWEYLALLIVPIVITLVFGGRALYNKHYKDQYQVTRV